MRVWLILLTLLSVAVFLVIDPVALTRLGYICVTGGCGVRPRWFAIGFAALFVLWLASKATAYFRKPPPPPPPPPKRARRKPAAPRLKKDIA